MATPNTSNAPMPPAGAAAPAEEFDSTIAPPTGNVSSIGLPGPDTREAPMHAGMANGVDPYFLKQYIALEQFTWTTSQDPATLLFSQPIHPLRSHQWMAYLSKIYNTFAGGFDFAFKVAGTGFHAGAIIIVRLPPNIPPSSIKTLADLTAFEYEVIDPKTLEVEIKSVMDQRNIMYHWMQNFDIDKPETFGGYIAAYVMIPLNTSSTGAAAINVQVWTKPSVNFQFSQVRPLYSGPQPVRNEIQLIEMAMDYRDAKSTGLTFKYGRDSGIVVRPERTNSYNITDQIQADGSNYTEANFRLTMKDGRFTLFPQHVNNLDSSGCTKKVGTDDWRGFALTGDNPYIEITMKDPINGANINSHFGGNWICQIIPKNAKDPGYLTLYAGASQPLPGLTRFSFNSIANVDPYKMTKVDVPGFVSDETLDKSYSTWLDRMVFSPQDTVSYLDDKAVAFTPNGGEVVCIPVINALGHQLGTVQHLFSTGVLKNFVHKGEAVFLELFDLDAELPVGKFKLYYEGFLCTAKPTTIVIYNFATTRYKFNFLKVGPASSPLFANAKELQKYRRNQSLAKLFSSTIE